ncbi:PIG-L family deacetylase [Candidatus Woesebacteria bacterium]|nr:PIG-L family deacetylase [Candidatus Woesebacteria bacterium]
MFTYDHIFENKKNTLFIMAHPDDILVYYGALVNKLSQDNKNIYILTVSNGARGSRDSVITEDELAQTRLNEEIEALNYLGVPRENIHFLHYKDGEIESTYKLIGEISKYIRKYKADVVCTHEPTGIYMQTYSKSGYFVQHRDHRKVAEAVIDSAYPFSRDRSFFPEHASEGIEPHSVYDIIMTDEKGSNFELDYTEDRETKKSAMRFHKTQFDEGTIQEIVDSVKNNDRFLEKYLYVKLLW